MLGSIGLVIVGVGRGGEVTLVALALCLLAALSWAIGNVISRASGSTGGLALTVWSAVVVPVPLLALSPLLDGPTAVGAALAGLSWQALVSTLYTAVLSSLVGYGIFNGLLGRNPSAAVVPWILLVPPVAMVSAWLLLGQVPNAAETAGRSAADGGRADHPDRLTPVRASSGPGGRGLEHGLGQRLGAQVSDLVVLRVGHHAAEVVAGAVAHEQHRVPGLPVLGDQGGGSVTGVEHLAAVLA